MLKYGKRTRIIIYLISLITTVALLTIPLFQYCINDSNITAIGWDCAFHISRIESIFTGLKAGEFPVYVYTFQSNGFGYPLGVMYPDFFLYPFAILRYFGISLSTCYILLIITICTLTFIVAYYSIKLIRNDFWCCLLFAIVYTLLPYHIINIYARFALGECLATIFMPFAVSSFYKLLYTKKKSMCFIFAFSYAAIVYSHILTTILFTIFLFIIFCIFCIANKTLPLKHIIFTGFIVLILCLPVLVPFCDYYFNYSFYQKTTDKIFKQGIFLDHIASRYPLSELLSFFVEPKTYQETGQIPIFVGWSSIMIIAIFPFLAITKKFRLEKNKLVVGWTLFLLSITTLLASTKLFPWEALKSNPIFETVLNFFSNFQFASRFLLFYCLFVSFLLVIELTAIHKSGKLFLKPLFCSILIIITMSSSWLYSIEHKNNTQIEYKIGEPPVQVVDALYLPVDFYNNNELLKLFMGKDDIDERFTILNPTVTNFQISQTGSTITLDVPSNNYGQNITLPIIKYPHFKVYDEYGQELEATANTNHLITFEIPTNDKITIKSKFDVPVLWQFSNWICLFTIILLVFYIIYERKQNIKFTRNYE